jgi:hypothetical protein
MRRGGNPYMGMKPADARKRAEGVVGAVKPVVKAAKQAAMKSMPAGMGRLINKMIAPKIRKPKY